MSASEASTFRHPLSGNASLNYRQIGMSRHAHLPDRPPPLFQPSFVLASLTTSRPCNSRTPVALVSDSRAAPPSLPFLT